MIKSVIFDIDGTMYDYDFAHNKAFEKVACYVHDNFFIDREDFYRQHKEVQKEIELRLGKNSSAIHNRLIRYEVFLEKLGKPLFPHTMNMYKLYWNTLIDNIIPEKGLREFMEYIKSLNIKIGVGTNMTAYMQYKKLEKLGVSKYIDFIVTSEEVGCEKPSEKFFEYCIEKSTFKPSECIFIGDSFKNDVEGAIKCGMKAVWYNNISYWDIIHNIEEMLY